MAEPIIEVRDLGKRYTISHEQGGYVALRDVLATVMRSPFSFAKSKAKQAVGLEKREEFWALKDINFTVNKGEVIGVIGRNGAGKSTLLKILSQITPPTEGEIVLRGRVGSLLEVGTGFHPELTGRENIFLNGAILGMRRAEIVKKFDEIVAFSGIERFLDTPVKRYSSGMYVRLAFSVAAHMEPDILLVDEVLAVGDAEFQKKCLGKMEEVTRKEGRTIMFVSHNMAAIQRLCEKSIVLDNGMIKWVGLSADVIGRYLQDSPGSSITKSGDHSAKITSCDIVNSKMEAINSIRSSERVGIRIAFEILDDDIDIFPNYALSTVDEITVFHSLCPLGRFHNGKHTVINWIPGHLLNNKKYKIRAAIMSSNPRTDHAMAESYFEVYEEPRAAKDLHGYAEEIHGVVRPELEWVEL